MSTGPHEGTEFLGVRSRQRYGVIVIVVVVVVSGEREIVASAGNSLWSLFSLGE